MTPEFKLCYSWRHLCVANSIKQNKKEKFDKKNVWYFTRKKKSNFFRQYMGLLYFLENLQWYIILYIFKADSLITLELEFSVLVITWTSMDRPI